jgi:hypothetical protein
MGADNVSLLLEQSMKSQFMSNTVSRDKSPNRVTIKHLSDKLSNMRVNALNQRKQQEQQIEKEIDELSKRVNNQHKDEAKNSNR